MENIQQCDLEKDHLLTSRVLHLCSGILQLLQPPVSACAFYILNSRNVCSFTEIQYFLLMWKSSCSTGAFWSVCVCVSAWWSSLKQFCVFVCVLFLGAVCRGRVGQPGSLLLLLGDFRWASRAALKDDRRAVPVNERRLMSKRRKDGSWQSDHRGGRVQLQPHAGLHTLQHQPEPLPTSTRPHVSYTRVHTHTHTRMQSGSPAMGPKITI